MSNYGDGTITERSPGRWRISIEVGRDPRTGQRRRHRFPVHGTRRDAQQALRKALHERDQGMFVPSGKITVADWLSGWLARHQSEGHIGPRAHDRYLGILRRHLAPALGRVKVQDLRPDHIADWKARWLSGDDSTADAPLSGATVFKHLVILRQALDAAVKAGLIARNPCDAVSSPSVKAAVERRALTEEEISDLVTRSSGTRYDSPVRFTLATGLRQGELLGLAWKAVDLDAATVDVSQTLSYVGGKVAFLPPKTDHSRRTIELSEATCSLLASHRLAQTKHRLQLGEVWQDNDLVFPSLIGTPWLPRLFYRGYRPIVDGSGITNPETVNWHTLRHTAASQWLRHGVDVFAVSRRLGHASAAFTMDTYAHLLKGQQRQAAEALDHLLAQA